MSMFQKRTGTGVPYHLFARFVGVEGDRVIVEEAGTERIHKVLITNEKSPNIPHFLGKKKIGTTDLSMEEGGFIKFDGMKSLVTLPKRITQRSSSARRAPSSFRVFRPRFFPGPARVRRARAAKNSVWSRSSTRPAPWP